MVTQVVEFEMVTGETGATAKLFAPVSDTVVASVTPDEATNRKGVYSASFTNIAAGTYRLIGFGSDGVPLTDPLWVTLTLTNGTFIAYVTPIAGGDATAANQTTIINHLTDIKGDGWSSATDTLEKIRDAITAALDSVIASVSVTPGALTGWPETMSIGDSYTDDCGRSIHLFVRDASDDPITSIGSHAFTDADFTATVILSQGAQRGRVIGTATWEVGPEGYLNVQIPSKESRRAAEGTATVQVLLRWTDSGDQYTLPATTTRWVAQL